jgi:GAF domain-containing protein
MAVRGRKARKRAPAKKPAGRARKAAAAKPTKSPTTKPRPRKANSPAAQSEIARLTHDLRVARDRQAASAEILRAIAASPGDAQRSLRQIAETTERLFSASAVTIRIAGEGDEWSHIVNVGEGAKRISATVSAEQLRISGNNMPGTVYRENRLIHLPDIEDVDAKTAEWPGLKPARAAGTRTLVGIPLRRDGRAIGALIVHRKRVAAFADDELALLQSFADQAVIAIENARLFRETNNALQQQTATADVLKLISRSNFDLPTVLDTLLESACHLSDADIGTIRYKEGDDYRLAATFGCTPEWRDYFARRSTRPDRGSVFGRTIIDGGIVHIPDVLRDLDFGRPDAQKLMGFRAALGVPLVREGQVFGVVNLFRFAVSSFTEKQIELVRTFADQAVIAIENTRLFNETREALERQTATADILKVIASSPSDLQPVFEAIAERSNRLLVGHSTAVYRFVDEIAHLAAFTAVNPEADATLQAAFPRPVTSTPQLQALLAGKVTLIPDVDAAGVAAMTKGLARARGFRSVMYVPLNSDRGAIGAISVTRKEAGAFAPHHVQLLQTFADQAVIAIQNVKLFDEVQARTRDLAESLQQQTATADVLKVISRSAFDLDSVMHALTQSAAELCKSEISALYLREGDSLVARGIVGTDAAQVDFLQRNPLPTDSTTYVGRSLLEGSVRNVADIESAIQFGSLKRFGEALGFRAILFVPLMREGRGVGVFALGRKRTGEFSQREVELVQTFADQAVIAIENVRLFDEVQTKTRDLQEALVYQTGSANILKVIASSPTDVGPVLKAIVESACELCDAVDAVVLLKEGNDLRFNMHHGPIPVDREKWPLNRNWVTGRVVVDGTTLHVRDLLSTEGDEFPEAQEMARNQGHRTVLSVPLLRENEAIGAIVLRRVEVQPFSDKQIALLQTFADQAVIAIENVRLFDEVQARTRDLSESLQQQTATADVLKVISRSTFDLQTVLHTLVESAAKLADAEKATITRQRDGMFYRAESYGFSQEFMDYVRNVPIIPDRSSATSRALLEGTVVHIPDVKADPDYTFNEAQRLGDFRSVLSVPMLREGTPVGVIVLTRTEPKPFTEKQIELVTTFADQAAIAIENVRLFEQVQTRTHELSRSLDELRTAQDRLVQTEKLASLGQLTAGIAHEIKNPLNFVNNFSALSSELIDELLDVLRPSELGGNIRQEVDELTHMLKGNLDKVVQHGKRADSIVKNMLLHSRSGSGEHRPTEINAIVEESLNLAYHGARAEKTGFNITLQRDLDPDVGLVDVYPQEMTRVLLNLISNGFYAATKRKAQAGDGFEPTLSASTKNLGDKVEIRVRDNGTGIPLDVKERMFNPFFTTKPAGEGTGLGLSMSHDIVVKQHQGRIDVETEPGVFTEFIITLPRAAAALAG